MGRGEVGLPVLRLIVVVGWLFAFRQVVRTSLLLLLLLLPLLLLVLSS